MPIDHSPRTSDLSLPEQAAQWHVLLNSDEVNDADRAAFNQWYSVRENAEAYQRMDALWARFNKVDSPVARTALKQELRHTRKQRRLRRFASTVGAAFILGLAMLFCWHYTLISSLSIDFLLADIKTGAGEQQTIDLPDGSQLVLNTVSAVNVQYSAQERIIHLVKGEVRIDVAKDPSRPLTVMGEQGSVQALGTQFSVRDDKTVTVVQVTESRVKACSYPVNVQGHQLSGGQYNYIEQQNNYSEQQNNYSERQTPVAKSSRCQTLQAGEQTRMYRGRVEPPQVAEGDFVHDWEQRQLIVDNQPLLRVLDELARYHKGVLMIDRTGLEAYRVSGVFPLNDTARSLQVITRSLPLHVRQFTPLLTSIAVQ